MHSIIIYHSLEIEYELEVDQEEGFPIPLPKMLIEQGDGTIVSSDGMVFDSIPEMTHHYKCEIVSLESEPGN